MAKMISVRLPQETAEELGLVAEFDGVAVAQEIREAVNLLLEARRNDPAFKEKILSSIEKGRQLLESLGETGQRVAKEL